MSTAQQVILAKIKQRLISNIATTSVSAESIIDRLKKRAEECFGPAKNPVCKAGAFVLYIPQDRQSLTTEIDWAVARIEQVVRRQMRSIEPEAGTNTYLTDMACGTTISREDYGWEIHRRSLRENEVVRVFQDEAQADAIIDHLMRATKLTAETNLVTYFGPVLKQCVVLAGAGEDIEHLVIEMEKLWDSIREPIKLFQTKMALFVD